MTHRADRYREQAGVAGGELDRPAGAIAGAELDRLGGAVRLPDPHPPVVAAPDHPEAFRADRRRSHLAVLVGAQLDRLAGRSRCQSRTRPSARPEVIKLYCRQPLLPALYNPECWLWCPG